MIHGKKRKGNYDGQRSLFDECPDKYMDTLETQMSASIQHTGLQETGIL